MTFEEDFDQDIVRFEKWEGPGWYGPIVKEGITHFVYIKGFDEYGYSNEGHALVWNRAKSLGMGDPEYLVSEEEINWL